MGDEEVDEAGIGGKARKMDHAKQIKVIRDERSFRKTVMVGLFERKGD
jgi:hypothetical protein